jgi:hypothetical protein
MMRDSPKSKLASSEVCQACARCCKTFTASDMPDFAKRFSWMDDKDIRVIDTPFTFGNGEKMKAIIYNKPCRQLGRRAGKYYCKVYRGDKPEFCATYPDQVFAGVKRSDLKEIRLRIDFEKQFCPIFETMPVQEIIRRIWGSDKKKMKKSAKRK